jgi:hypothetical protein
MAPLMQRKTSMCCVATHPGSMAQGFLEGQRIQGNCGLRGNGFYQEHGVIRRGACRTDDSGEDRAYHTAHSRLSRSLGKHSKKQLEGLYMILFLQDADPIHLLHLQELAE